MKRATVPWCPALSAGQVEIPGKVLGWLFDVQSISHVVGPQRHGEFVSLLCEALNVDDDAARRLMVLAEQLGLIGLATNVEMTPEVFA